MEKQTNVPKSSVCRRVNIYPETIRFHSLRRLAISLNQVTPEPMSTTLFSFSGFDTIELMTKIKQPNSKMCFICGLKNPIGLHLHIYETEPGVVESTYIAPEHFQGYPGVLHGGIVGAILDEMSGRSQMGSDILAPRFMFTARLAVKYRKNVPIGKPLRIIGKAGKSKGKTAEAWAGIYDNETDELLAEGNALLINVPQEQFDLSKLGELDWKIYPDEFLSE